LYVSYRSTEPGLVLKGSLYFNGGPGDEQDEVLRRARPYITDALRVLKASQTLTFATEATPQRV